MRFQWLEPRQRPLKGLLVNLFKIYDKIHDQMRYKICEDGKDDDDELKECFIAEGSKS